MTTIGKVCMWLAVIGLAVISVWLLPAVGSQHNEISAKLLASETTLNTAVDSHRKQKQELEKRRHELARLQIGWDKSWTIQTIGDSGVNVNSRSLAINGLGTEFELDPVLNDDGQPVQPLLVVRGLGTGSGLNTVLDDAGQEVQPVVQAFVTMPERGIFYVGEFQADQLDATSCTLVPNWQVTQDEVNVWLSNLQSPWRFRTMVPAGNRLEIDQRHVQLQKLSELYTEIKKNVVQQEASLQQAESELLVRKEELLGNPDGQVIPGRPEYRDGLLNTISAAEDRRNDLLIQVDTLRREVREGSEKRQELLDQLKETTEQLAAAEGDQITQADAGVR